MKSLVTSPLVVAYPLPNQAAPQALRMRLRRPWKSAHGFLLGLAATLLLTAAATPSQAENPPVLAPIGNKTVFVRQTVQFTVTTTDPDGDKVYLSMTGTPNGDTWHDQTGEFELGALHPSGRHLADDL